jgi:hypothetical protein
LKPSVRFDWHDADRVLNEEADWDESAFKFSVASREALAATVLALPGALGPGWGLRSYWVGDKQEREVSVTAEELAALVRDSKLDRKTLYRVR